MPTRKKKATKFPPEQFLLDQAYLGLEYNEKDGESLSSRAWVLLYTLVTAQSLRVQGDTTLAFMHGKGLLNYSSTKGYSLSDRGWLALYWESESRHGGGSRAMYDGLRWAPGRYGTQRARLGRIRLGVAHTIDGLGLEVWSAAVQPESGNAFVYPKMQPREHDAKMRAFVMAAVLHRGSHSVLIDTLKATLKGLRK